MTQGSKRALVADANMLSRSGLALILRRDLGFADVRELTDFHEVSGALAENSFDLVAVDLDLAGMNGITGLRHLRVRTRGARLTVMGSTLDRELILEALDAGVDGCLPKDLDAVELIKALRVIVQGMIYVPPLMTRAAPPAPVSGDRRGFGAELGGERAGDRPAAPLPLTERQLQVLELAVTGKSNKEIARQLDIAESTVKVHISAALRMLGVKNRVAAIAALQQQQQQRAQRSPMPGEPGFVERRMGDRRQGDRRKTQSPARLRVV